MKQEMNMITHKAYYRYFSTAFLLKSFYSALKPDIIGIVIEQVFAIDASDNDM